MSLQKTPIAGFSYITEASYTLAQLAVTGTIVASANGIATVTSAAHGLAVGQVVTFQGATGATGYNGTAFPILSVPTVNTFTIPSSISGTAAGTILCNPLVYPTAGMNVLNVGANAIVEYNPDNTGSVQADPTNTVTGAVWRTYLAASTVGELFCDGFAMRINFNTGSAGTTRVSRIK